MFDVDIEKEIQEHQKRIEELKELKIQAEQREQGFRKFDEAIQQSFEEFGLTEYDLFLMKSQQIADWLEWLSDQESQPGAFERIKEVMGKLYAKENGLKQGKRGPAKGKGRKKANDIKLPIGVYVHPDTGEEVEKKRRNPKTLDIWVEEYGAEQVMEWLAA